MADLARLTWTFLWLSFLCVGGGLGVIPEMERQAVSVHQWLTAREFVDGYTLTQLTPGPNMIAARAVDVCQPDVAIAGGITETQRIAALAAAHDLTVAPHLWGSAILFAAGLHLAISTPCVSLLEFSRGHNPLLNDLVEEAVAFEDGHVLAPTGPGLGLTLERDFVERVAVRS